MTMLEVPTRIEMRIIIPVLECTRIQVLRAAAQINRLTDTEVEIPESQRVHLQGTVPPRALPSHLDTLIHLAPPIVCPQPPWAHKNTPEEKSLSKT